MDIIAEVWAAHRFLINCTRCFWKTLAQYVGIIYEVVVLFEAAEVQRTFLVCTNGLLGKLHLLKIITVESKLHGLLKHGLKIKLHSAQVHIYRQVLYWLGKLETHLLNLFYVHLAAVHILNSCGRVHHLL